MDQRKGADVADEKFRVKNLKVHRDELDARAKRALQALAKRDGCIGCEFHRIYTHRRTLGGRLCASRESGKVRGDESIAREFYVAHGR